MIKKKLKTHSKEKRKEKMEWREEVREVQGEGPQGQENL
jgi:hypothetical protein